MAGMGTYEALITAVSIMLSLFITWTCICAVNGMSPKTRLISRLAYVLLGTGAIGVAMYPIWFHRPVETHVLLLLVSIALIAFDKLRLQRSITRHHRIQ